MLPALPLPYADEFGPAALFLELFGVLENQLGVPIPPSQLIENPTIEKAAGSIVMILENQEGAPSTPAASAERSRSGVFSAKVAIRSVPPTISEDFEPAGILPVHLKKAGTRQPPSRLKGRDGWPRPRRATAIFPPTVSPSSCTNFDRAQSMGVRHIC